jgi:hypothetical protein
MPKGPLLAYSDKLYDIFDDIGDKVSDQLMRIEGDPILDNEIGIEMVDKSSQDWSFDVKIGGKYRPMKVGQFIRYFLGTTFTEEEIKSFTQKYNLLKKGKPLPTISKDVPVSKSVKVEVPKFTWNPKDVRATFISLVTETYPHGHEEEVVPFIAQAGLKKDEFGNYYKIIGRSETMFTSHLDTADRKKSKVTLYSETDDGQEHFMSDGTTILGADDKAGVTVMLYLISHNIPGVYYFFIGEERGGIGSGKVSSIFEKVEHLKGIKRCVSFDRRNYYSVITEQLGMECCSDQFAQALANQYNAQGMKFSLDPTGIYTDSASFIDQIPECTNISVGYFDEHTTKESQNITYLEKLAKASVNVKWEDLPTAKKVGLDEETLAKYGKFISEFKATPFNMECKIIGDRGKAYIKVEMDETDVDLVSDDLLNLSYLFNKHDIDPPVSFDDEFIKMELEKSKGYGYYRKYLDSFNQFNEAWDDLDDWNEYQYKPTKKGYQEEEFEKEQEDDRGEGERGELAYWIRQMFKANKIESTIETENYDLISYIFLSKREKMSNLLNVFEVINKIKKDLLTTYSAEVELYENKEGYPVLKFTFSYDAEIPGEDGEIEMEDEKAPF